MKKRKPNVAVIGVGAVGIEILRILRERKFPLATLRVFARSRRPLTVDGNSYQVEELKTARIEDIDIAIFAGTEGEKGAAQLYAHSFIEKGAVVIDNGADFRLKEGVPLVVPEINREKVFTHQGLIANPNCTTIQAVVALGGIYKQCGLEQVILTSFQATSGAGRAAVQRLWEETKCIVNENQEASSYSTVQKRATSSKDKSVPQIAFNVVPQIGSFQKDNYTSEEWKVVNETHKIFADTSMRVSATCVRVPVFTSHSEAIYFSTKEKVSLQTIEAILKESAGVSFFPHAASFPLPLDAEGKDPVFVGRVRQDPFCERSFWLWCVADNLRKGAALNAIQIAECFIA